MQLVIPKCIEDGWVESGTLKPNAPKWAVREFERYQSLIKRIEEADEGEFIGSIPQPKFIIDGWALFDEETEEYTLKTDAPDWAKKEFAEYCRIMNNEPDIYGVCTRY